MTFVYVILFAIVLSALVQAIRKGRRRPGTWSDNGYTSTDTSWPADRSSSSYEPATRGGLIGPAVAAGAVAGAAIGSALGADTGRDEAVGGGSSVDSGSGSDSGSSDSGSSDSSSSTD